MNTTDERVHGPVDFLLLEFPTDRMTGEAADAIADLVEREVIRLYDLTLINKDSDGTVTILELTDPETGPGSFSLFAASQSGLIDDSDVEEAGHAMENDTTAALLIYENTWAVPFVAAAQANGAQVIASQRIPAADVAAALDALELD